MKNTFLNAVHALGDNGPGEDGGAGGAVTGSVVGVVGHVLDELGADVLQLVGQLDCFGDGDTVLGD